MVRYICEQVRRRGQVSVDESQLCFGVLRPSEFLLLDLPAINAVDNNAWEANTQQRISTGSVLRLLIFACLLPVARDRRPEENKRMMRQDGKIRGLWVEVEGVHVNIGKTPELIIDAKKKVFWTRVRKRQRSDTRKQLRRHASRPRSLGS